MTYIIDTCILSKLRKINAYPNPELEFWFMKHSEKLYSISVISIGEIQSGITKLGNSEPAQNKKKNKLVDWLFGELIPRFQDRILPIDQEVMLNWGRMHGDLKRKGITIGMADSLIAATAKTHQMILVTDNVKDFQYFDVQIYNPCQVQSLVSS